MDEKKNQTMVGPVSFWQQQEATKGPLTRTNTRVGEKSAFFLKAQSLLYRPLLFINHVEPDRQANLLS